MFLFFSLSNCQPSSSVLRRSPLHRISRSGAPSIRTQLTLSASYSSSPRSPCPLRTPLISQPPCSLRTPPISQANTKIKKKKKVKVKTKQKKAKKKKKKSLRWASQWSRWACDLVDQIWSLFWFGGGGGFGLWFFVGLSMAILGCGLLWLWMVGFAMGCGWLLGFWVCRGLWLVVGIVGLPWVMGAWKVRR